LLEPLHSDLVAPHTTLKHQAVV